MRSRNMFVRAAFVAVATLAGASFADDRTVESTLVNMGRGQYVVIMLPRAPRATDNGYALTGETNAPNAQPHVRLGIRGQTIFVP